MSSRNLAMTLFGAVALAAIAGCATSPRSYYSDGGDYYYGAPRADVIVDYGLSYGYPGWSYGLGGYGGGYGYGGGFGGYYGGFGGYGYHGYGYSPWSGYGGYLPVVKPQYPQSERRNRGDSDIAFRQGASGRERVAMPRSSTFAPARVGASGVRAPDTSRRAFAPQRNDVRSAGYAPANRSGMSDNRGAPLSGIGPRVQSSPSVNPSRRAPAPRNDAFQPRSAPSFRSAPMPSRAAPMPSRSSSPPTRTQSAPTRK